MLLFMLFVVLLIDDDVFFVQLFSFYVKIYGCEVVVVMMFQCVVFMFWQYDVLDLVVFDFGLLDGSGLDLMYYVLCDMMEWLVVVIGDFCVEIV